MPFSQENSTGFIRSFQRRHLGSWDDPFGGLFDPKSWRLLWLWQIWSEGEGDSDDYLWVEKKVLLVADQPDREDVGGVRWWKTECRGNLWKDQEDSEWDY